VRREVGAGQKLRLVELLACRIVMSQIRWVIQKRFGRDLGKSFCSLRSDRKSQTTFLHIRFQRG
jgi:hypothetical protein